MSSRIASLGSDGISSPAVCGREECSCSDGVMQHSGEHHTCRLLGSASGWVLSLANPPSSYSLSTSLKTFGVFLGSLKLWQLPSYLVWPTLHCPTALCGAIQWRLDQGLEAERLPTSMSCYFRGSMDSSSFGTQVVPSLPAEPTSRNQRVWSITRFGETSCRDAGVGFLWEPGCTPSTKWKIAPSTLPPSAWAKPCVSHHRFALTNVMLPACLVWLLML